MRCSDAGKQYNSQDSYRVITCDSTMAKLFQYDALANIRRSGFLLLPLVWQLLTTLVCGMGIAAAENYAAVPGVAVATKDNGVASTLTDYLKSYSIGVNRYDNHRQHDSIEYQNDYSNTLTPYGSGGSGVSSIGSGSRSDEQQSHISSGYNQPQPGPFHHSVSSGNAYEVPHQSDIDKFVVENNFSHEYGPEPDGGSVTASGSDSDGPSSSDHYQSHSSFAAPQHHQHTDVINYVPYPVVKKLHVPYAKPVQIPISHAVIIPVRKPVPIHIPITRQIQVPVEKELKVPVERLVPYPVEKQIPVPVDKHVPYPVVRYVPIKVPKPYAVKVPVVKTVVHKIKQFW